MPRIIEIGRTSLFEAEMLEGIGQAPYFIGMHGVADGHKKHPKREQQDKK